MDEPDSDFINNHKHPPMLNWKERETGLPGQPPLPSLEDRPSKAEMIFLSLSNEWKKGVTAKDAKKDYYLPWDLDELALSCLLLARDYGSSFTEVAKQDMDANITLLEKPLITWIYKLPWQLATASMDENPENSYAVDALVANLNHHNSSIRTWMVEIGWLVRKWLKAEHSLDPLLENIASALVGVEISWGLAASLFENQDDFYEAAKSWELPENVNHFKSQYDDRCNELSKMGTTYMQGPLWKLEARCRQIITERSLSITHLPEPEKRVGEPEKRVGP